MKKLTLWMMALAALPGSALQAQNITGNWQGSLQARKTCASCLRLRWKMTS